MQLVGRAVESPCSATSQSGKGIGRRSEKGGVWRSFQSLHSAFDKQVNQVKHLRVWMRSPRTIFLLPSLSAFLPKKDAVVL